MGKFDDIAPDITFDPPKRHVLAGKKIKIKTRNGIEDGKIIHVFGDNQYFLVVITDYYFYMNRRFECVRGRQVKSIEK